MEATSRIRFGMFDFDPATRELRCEGVPVRLQPQPAQVLAELVKHAGEVVTRDQLRQAVWGTDTFVDFERGLNFCVAQIRAALGDSAESPRFVRTIPKQGYQFVAPIAPAIAVAAPPPPAPRSHRRTYIWAAAVAFLICSLVTVALAVRRPPINIAIARFDNETGNSDMDPFADGLTDAVVAELTIAGGPRYGIIGNAAMLRQPRSQRDIKAIGSSLKAGYVVLGQVQRNSSHIRVLAHLIRMPEQTHLWVVRADRDIVDPLQTESELAHLIADEFSRRLASSRPPANR